MPFRYVTFKSFNYLLYVNEKNNYKEGVKCEICKLLMLNQCFLTLLDPRTLILLKIQRYIVIFDLKLYIY